MSIDRVLIWPLLMIKRSVVQQITYLTLPPVRQKKRQHTPNCNPSPTADTALVSEA